MIIRKYFAILIASDRNVTMAEVQQVIDSEKEVQVIATRVGNKSVLIKVRTEKCKNV